MIISKRIDANVVENVKVLVAVGVRDVVAQRVINVDREVSCHGATVLRKLFSKCFIVGARELGT